MFALLSFFCFSNATLIYLSITFNDLNDTHENNSLSVSNLSLASKFIFYLYLTILKETFLYKS